VLTECTFLQDMIESDRHYLSDNYKREVVEQMGVSQLIDTVMINPTVSLRPSGQSVRALGICRGGEAHTGEAPD
jgi:hypothetical protein